ncbi:ribosomal lysine N-methyltransferase 3 isoform X2 [Diospyros lotus]|uniref:ribosomal lysine N-methyltransferase 3 isoform X2 n=1 Tax=Diospyros lotus TaxID=55363 RepID=UPI00225BC97C|nr:ribosomal lysine N-methyltransferase 3 isoform X2 [Diospyros lotus]
MRRPYSGPEAATATATATARRRLRAFKRWMRSQGIECSDTLGLRVEEVEGNGIRVIALSDLQEGDAVVRIPKKCCLTIKTSGARSLIESAGLDGTLGLCVALMFEKSLGHRSPWFPYLHLLPAAQSIPLLWTLDQLNSLLLGTELHKIVKEDKALIYEDWQECILPLLDSAPLTIYEELNPDFFSVEEYFAAKSLVASRSFEIDDYHGFGMVPLADLFNHKTGAEDLHLTSIFLPLVHVSDAEDNLKRDEYEMTDDVEENHGLDEYNNSLDAEQLTQKSQLRQGSCGNKWECSSTSEDEPTVLEMIMVKDVKCGAEVFNTYGTLGNAALLHRYGFTEADNPYDIVNMDLELVLEWSSSLYSSRHSRRRLALWRRLDYSGCVSQNSEYFEISGNGEPQVELLILLYIISLPDEPFDQLDLTVSSTEENLNEWLSIILEKGGYIQRETAAEMSKDLLLTRSVCDALLSLANIRESFFGSNSLEDDMEALNKCCCIKERELYYSLILRISERRILEKLRIYAAESAQLSATGQSKRASTMRKKMKTRR